MPTIDNPPLIPSQWYWKLFASDEGYQLMDQHLESLFTIVHGKPESWLETMCVQDGVKTYLEANKTQPVEAYVTPAMREDFLKRLKQDSLQAPQQWYRSMVQGEQDIANKSIPEANIVVNVPTLFFGGTRDMVCRPELLGPSVQAGLLPHLKTVSAFTNVY